MNLAVLDNMKTETLLALKAQVEKVLESRLDNTISIGRTGRFTTTKTNESIHALVERINVKTIRVTELGDSVRPGRTWNISKQMFKLDPVEKQGPVSKKPAPAKPATTMENSW